MQPSIPLTPTQGLRQNNDKESPYTRYTVFVPLNHNDGHHMQEKRLEWILDRINSFAGGLTIFPFVIGFWVDARNKVIQDLLMLVQVVVVTDPVAEVFFTRLASELAVILEQQQIFIIAQPVHVVESISLLEPSESAELLRDGKTGNSRAL
jgi:hypothetical protein